MEISQRGIYYGKKGVRRAVELFGPQNIEKDHVHNHIQLQPLITISADGQRAWVRARALSMLGTYKQVGVWGDGVYENEFVKEKGVWKHPHRSRLHHVLRAVRSRLGDGFATDAEGEPEDSAGRATVGRVRKLSGRLQPGLSLQESGDGRRDRWRTRRPISAGCRRARARTFADVEKTVTRLEDEDAIENLQRAYGFYIDKAQWKDAADLFADNGSLELGGGGVYVGKKRIQDYVTRTSPEGLVRGKMFNYLQLQPIVDVANDGKSAKGRWRFVAEIGTADQADSAEWGGGTYENEYVKEDGVWKIQRLHGYYRFFTAVRGWLGKEGPAEREARRELQARPAAHTGVRRLPRDVRRADFTTGIPVTGK